MKRTQNEMNINWFKAFKSVFILLSNKQSNVIQIHRLDSKACCSHFSLESTNNFAGHCWKHTNFFVYSLSFLSLFFSGREFYFFSTISISLFFFSFTKTLLIEVSFLSSLNEGPSQVPFFIRLIKEPPKFTLFSLSFFLFFASFNSFSFDRKTKK